MSNSIQIEGLDELRRRLRAAPQVLEAELRSAERAALDLARDEARRLAPGNKMANSINIERASNGLSGVVGSAAKTAFSIEMGRPVGQMPSAELIAAWMNRSGIVSDGATRAGATVSTKTHRVTGRHKASVSRAQRSMAWRIALGIKERGTKPQPFIGPVLPTVSGRIDQLFEEAVQRVLRKVAK